MDTMHPAVQAVYDLAHKLANEDKSDEAQAILDSLVECVGRFMNAGLIPEDIFNE